MANRNSTSLVLPGNPLGSVLREVARDARRSTRDPNATQYATEESLATLQAQVDALQGQVAALQGQVPLGHAIVTSDAFGLASWTYPVANPYPAPAVPVIHATVLIIDNTSVTVHTVTATDCQIGVRHPNTGAAYPGAQVFLTAYPSALVP